MAGSLTAGAAPRFTDGTRYHIVCRQFTAGCVTDGALANQSTPLYYLQAATTSDETYWYFTEEEDGLYSIRNASTNQYVTYDGVRQNIADAGQLRRYLNMTDEMDGSRSLWSINRQSDGIYTIRNVGQSDHIWDVRTDSYCVGTYSNTGNGNQNQQFSFYDEEGNIVVEKTIEPQPEPDGFDVSSWLDATTESPDGWTYEGSTWGDPGFGNYVNGDASVVSPFLERWQDTRYGGLANTAVSQTLLNLPANAYSLQADIIAVRQPSNNGWVSISEEIGTGVWLFAGNEMREAGTHNERPQRFTVSTTLARTGELTVGLRLENTNANWVAFDNMRLYFLGTLEELIEGEKVKVRTELAEYYDDTETEQKIAACGDSFEALEQLRKSVANLPKTDPLGRAISGLTIDGHTPTYVESLDLYLCTLPSNHFGKDYSALVDYTPKEGAGTLYIDGQATPAASEHLFTTIEGGKNWQLRIAQPNGNIVTKQLTFTSLPVVSIHGSFNNSYSDGLIAVNEPGKAAPQLLNMKAKWRGGITNSSGKHKRNYHVKLLDADGQKLEKKFFGLRNDNSWILEACQVDMSRIRNRVLTDLWNDYCTEPYYFSKEPKALSGTRGKFVELILNGEYRGIYCMTENMDRKQMKLMKYDETTDTHHGQLWKSKDWSYAVFMGTRPDGGYQPKDYLSDPYGYTDMWDSYQVKYPDIDDVQPADWQTLYDAVYFVCYSEDDMFRRDIALYFDIPVVIDYYILMETILSSDNHGKNMFFAVYDKQRDKKITFGVWDMDATCGQRWSDDYWHSDLMTPEQDYATFIATHEHGDYNLFKRLRDTDAEQFNERVRQRYCELRNSHLSTESILERFRTYLDEFALSGADQREYRRWNGDTDISRRSLDFDGEMDYIADWFTRRMNYLDTQRFDIGSLGIETAQSPIHSADQTITDLKGRIVGTTDQLRHLPAGIYIVNGKKVMVK